MSVAVIDVDHFKRFNDGYGREAGDLVLRETGRVLRESLRASDIACRIGGEELVVVLPDATAENARMRLEQVRASIRATELTCGGKVLPTVTLSAGIAEAPAHGSAADVAARGRPRALRGQGPGARPGRHRHGCRRGRRRPGQAVIRGARRPPFRAAERRRR